MMMMMVIEMINVNTVHSTGFNNLKHQPNMIKDEFGRKRLLPTGFGASAERTHVCR